MTSSEVRRIRGNLTQEAFARKLGVTVSAVRHWEQDLRKPSGAAVLLLQVIQREGKGKR